MLTPSPLRDGSGRTWSHLHLIRGLGCCRCWGRAGSGGTRQARDPFCRTMGSRTSPGLENGPGKGQDSSTLSSARTQPGPRNGYPQQTLAALSPPTRGLFPLWEGSGEPGGPAGVCVRGRRFPQAGRAVGGLQGKGRGRVPPLSAAPASEPGSPAGRALPGAPRSRLPLPEPASQRRPEPPLLLPSRFLPGGRLPRRPPVHPSCRCPRRGDKAGMATRGAAELGEAPSVINFHQAAPTTAPGILRWAGRCGDCREA